MAVVVVVVAFVVVVVAFTGFSVITGGFSGLSGRVGGPRGGGGGTWPVVLEGGRGGCLPGVGMRSLGFGAGGSGVDGILRVADGAGGFSSPVRVGERVRGGVGSTGGCLGSRPGRGPELGNGEGGGRWV